MIKRWKIYLSYNNMIVSLLYLVITLSCGITFNLVSSIKAGAVRNLPACVLSVFCFYLYIRIRDEFKDFEYDIIHNPDRPVPSGGVDLFDLKVLNIINLILLIVVNVIIGIKISFIVCLILFILCGRDFFVKSIIESNRMFVLATHSPIYLVLIIYISSFSTTNVKNIVSVQYILIYIIFFIPIMLQDIGKKVLTAENKKFSYGSLSRRGVGVLVLFAYIVHSIAYQGFFWGMTETIINFMMVCFPQILYSLVFLYCWIRCLFTENKIYDNWAAILTSSYIMSIYTITSMYGLVSMITKSC